MRGRGVPERGRAMNLAEIALVAALAIIAVAAGCHDSNNTVTGPSPAPAPALTPTVPVAHTPAPVPPAPTPTPMPPGNMTATVSVGPNGSFSFVDQASGSSTTTIGVGGTVNWMWATSPHSTTSGTCSGACQPSGMWDSGIQNSGANFSHTFGQRGSFPYFCRVHGAMMQGMVVVQ
jgi:plastocyanin